MFAMVKRIFLFLLVNILILTTINIIWSIAAPYFGIQGNADAYLVFYSLVFGMGGAFVSLLLSKFMAKMMMKVQVIDPQSEADPFKRQLVERVHDLARKARLPKMPEVGIYDSPEVNAFATGPSKRNSLVAVSTGLLHQLNDDQVDGVLGHEVAHIANGDMVTMTLLQGIINAMVLFFARIIARVIVSSSDREGNGGGMYFIIVIVLQILLSILGSLVVSFFSRHREYRADSGGAKLAGRDKMISALKALSNQDIEVDPDQEAIASLKISGKTSSFLQLFSTHPPIEERIHRLETGR